VRREGEQGLTGAGRGCEGQDEQRPCSLKRTAGPLLLLPLAPFPDHLNFKLQNEHGSKALWVATGDAVDDDTAYLVAAWRYP